MDWDAIFEVADLGVFPIDVVGVNLYRFEETVARTWRRRKQRAQAACS